MKLNRKNQTKPAEGSVINAHTELVAVLIKRNKDGTPVRTEVRRVIKDKMVTTAFVNYLVDSLEGTQADWINFKYHDSGIGVVAEAIGDTGLGTPWGGARSTGTQIDGTTANIYKSVATTTYNATKAITEHGLFNAAAAGTLMDRSVFAAINVVDTNQIEWTFTITFTAGG